MVSTGFPQILADYLHPGRALRVFFVATAQHSTVLSMVVVGE
jgi:hypothetical protein